MACDSNDGASVTFVWIEPLIEQADVILAMSLDANGAVASFNDGPLEIVVDVAACASMANVATAGDDARNKARVTRYTLYPRVSFCFPFFRCRLFLAVLLHGLGGAQYPFVL